MSAHAFAGAAAAATKAKQQQSSGSARPFFHRNAMSHSAADQKEMQKFEEEYMRRLTQTALQRFAASGTVPPADTRESLLEWCNSAAESMNNNNNNNNKDDDQEKKNAQSSDHDADDEDVDDSALDAAQKEHRKESLNKLARKTLFRRPLELDDSLLKPEEKRAFRAKEHNLWLLSCPNRLRQWMKRTDSSCSSDPLPQSSSSSGLKLDPAALSGSSSNNSNFDLSIFCDMIVRLPVLGAGRDEVVSFCEQFGPVEYQGPCRVGGGGASKKKSSKNNSKDVPDSSSSSSSSSSPREYCHIVRFLSGADAVKCFIELNGYFLDPQSCKKSLEELVISALRKSQQEILERRKRKQQQKQQKQKKDQNDEEEDDDDEEEEDSDDEEAAAAHKVLNQIPQLLSELHVESGEKFDETKDDEVLRCWSSRLVFVTCDFFRAAFYDKNALVSGSVSDFIPRAEMPNRSCYDELGGSGGRSATSSSPSMWTRLFGGGGDTKPSNSSSNNRGSVPEIPAEWNPVDIVCARLTQRARELICVYPLVASHSDIEWVGMCRAANCISFFLPRVSEQQHSSSNGNNGVWFLTLKALRQCKVNIVALFRAIDAATDTDDLLEGSRGFGLRSGPMEPPSPERAKTAEKVADPNAQSPTRGGGGGKNGVVSLLSNFAAGRKVVDFFAGFLSPDPGQRGSNRLVEVCAFVILIIAVMWAGVTTHSMLLHPKPRKQQPAAVKKDAAEAGDL